jgi:PTS system nitrogen regulatory IIA component
MRLTDLLQPEAVFASLHANSKKQLLQELSDRAAHIAHLPARQIFDAVLQRERLGSTGIGNGIAIPHAKLTKCPSIIGVFAHLEKPVDFEAIDAAPVDLVFLLVAPESAGADHLKALARIARVLRDPAMTAKLRTIHDSAALYAVLTQEPASHAA